VKVTLRKQPECSGFAILHISAASLDVELLVYIVAQQTLELGCLSNSEINHSKKQIELVIQMTRNAPISSYFRIALSNVFETMFLYVCNKQKMIY
jgi:hypothetical protein